MMHILRFSRLSFLVTTLVCLAVVARASQLTEVVPIHNRLLALHFVDGSVAYHGIGQPIADVVTTSPLTVAALAAGAFTVTSSGDPSYNAGAAPTGLGRKSKGREFAANDTNWVEGFGFRPTTPYAALEHWVYLQLPAALERGRAYTISWSASALNTTAGTTTFNFDDTTLRSEAVHVNILGYAPAAPQKFGYLYHWAGSLGGVDFAPWAGQPFRVVRSGDGSVAHSGVLAFRKAANNVETSQPNDTPNANFLGAAVWEADFSGLNTPGEYRLFIPGVGVSFPFRIDRDVYREAFLATLHGLFLNRSGIAIGAPHAVETRPAPHNPRPVIDGGTPGFQNRLKYSSTRFIDVTTDGGGDSDKLAIETGAKGNLAATWGWYQDAGDWDGYISHVDIPLGLLVLYQLYPEKFVDGEMNIPESGNGIPDIVDEAAWLPRFFHRQRAELLTKGWGTGGVGARVFGDYWGDDRPGGIGRGSWQDTTRDWYVTGQDPFSTYRYAAAAAQLADILQTLGQADPAGVDWAAEAAASYTWAAANTLTGDESKNASGLLKEHRALAAAALYRLTGTASYHTQIQTDLADITVASEGLTGPRLNAAALYLTMPPARTTEAGLVTRLRGALKATALKYTTASADRRALRWGGDFSFPMLIGQPTTPHLQPAVLAHRILAADSASAAAAADVFRVAHTTADYFLGTNSLNQTWITGVGERFPTGLFCMDDFYTGPALRRGMTPYGPWRFPESWVGNFRMTVSAWWAWDLTFPTIDARGAFQNLPGAVAPGTWPGHEAWFDNRNIPQTGEFTIHQNNLPNALAYGFLVADISEPPAITTPPAGGAVVEGTSRTLTVVASGPGPLQYQWRKDGVDIPGADASTYLLRAAQKFQAGAYTVVVTGPKGSVVSAPAAITVTDATTSSATKAVNISTRAVSGVGDNVLVPGFVIEGSGTRKLLVRAVGPRLVDFGVSGVLADPTLEIVRTSTPAGLVVTADDWLTDGAAAEIITVSAAVGAFSLDGSGTGGTADGKSAVAILDLPAGSYTPICRGKGDTQGIAIVEIYDVSGTGSARLVNLSNRGLVGTGDQVMIPGFAVSGPSPRSYLIRAAGPALAAFGVSGSLANPQIRVVANVDGNPTVATNDDWAGAPNDPVALAATSATVGAFPFATGSRDAALRVTLPPGSYSVVCRGVGDTTGVALVEVYELP